MVVGAAAGAARTGRNLTAAIAFRSTGFSINALLHRARHRRLARPADAVLAAPAPRPSPRPGTTTATWHARHPAPGEAG